MTERITWTQNSGIGRSGWTGFVEQRKLFTIEMSMTRGEGYRLRTRLPFNLVDEKSKGDADDLKVYAERVLETFVYSLGAAWPS